MSPSLLRVKCTKSRLKRGAKRRQPTAVGANGVTVTAHKAATIGVIVMVALVHLANAIIGTLPPVSDSNWTDTTSIEPAAGDAMIAAFNTQLRALAATHGYKLADYHAALTMSDGVTQNSALFIDGLHPNDQGNAAMWAVADQLIRACGLNQ